MIDGPQKEAIYWSTVAPRRFRTFMITYYMQFNHSPYSTFSVKHQSFTATAIAFFYYNNKNSIKTAE
jgi:hypothetical protein